MKKVFILAALAAMVLTSCVEEKSFDEKKLGGENSVSFVLQGGAATRSSEAESSVRTGEIIPVTKVDGVEIFMEETITDLNTASPVTRGTPLYTENLGQLFPNKLAVRAGTVDAIYSLVEDTTPQTDEGWLFNFDYTSNIWPDNADTGQDFYLRVPSDFSTSYMTSYTTAASTTSSGSVATVNYTSPVTAEATTDIAFGGITMSKNQYLGFRKNDGGAKVTLYHALTGVKFALANTPTEVANIQINKITFTGLKNSGSFTFTASTTALGKGTIAWTTSSAAPNNVISQEFTKSDFIADYSTTKNKFGETFFTGGTKQNVNDSTATKTFWLVPQTTADSNATLKIEYSINGEDEYMEINLSDLKSSNWQAGELRTYTFKINEVNVKIADKVNVPSTATAANGYKDSFKNQVTITNTGNTTAFIRAALVGQWVDSNGDPVFGFTDRVNTLHVVESWWQDQFGKGVTSDHDHGEFIGLAGYKNSGSTGNTDGSITYNNWVLCTDGYYYYKKAVAPNGTTSALFDSYTVKTKPNVDIAADEGINTNMHFTLEISTQAIAATELDGTVKQTGEGDDKEDDWASAWAKALGSAPQPGHPQL